MKQTLILYHGSPISNLKNLKEGSGVEYQKIAGIYLTKNKKLAEKYTKIDGKTHPENIYTVKAVISKPISRLELDKLNFKNRDNSFMNGLQRRNLLIKLGYDSVIDDFMDEVIVFNSKNLKILKQKELSLKNIFITIH